MFHCTNSPLPLDIQIVCTGNYPICSPSTQWIFPASHEPRPHEGRILCILHRTSNRRKSRGSKYLEKVFRRDVEFRFRCIPKSSTVAANEYVAPSSPFRTSFDWSRTLQTDSRSKMTLSYQYLSTWTGFTVVYKSFVICYGMSDPHAFKLSTWNWT